ncbi:MAG: ribosome biogenesis GTPase Der [Alphaproteobacteria bacterium]
MPANERLLRVAIVGRPNVGKSTLFNRLVSQRIALVDDEPGVTRDRREGEARLGDLSFVVIDTAGLEEAPDGSLARRMHAQSEAAIREADVNLFVIDARAGVTPADEHFARMLRSHDKPTVLLANKGEGRAADAGVLETYALGFGDPVRISAEHGEGMADLYDAIRQAGEAIVLNTEPASDVPPGLRVAIVGRPNSGKSTLVNQILGEERLLTGEEAGITRDSIAVDWMWRGQQFRFFDTAGIRRKARVAAKLEKLAVGDALRAIRFAEVVVLLLDAAQPFDKQDLQIADLIEREGRALVIAVNKWDMVSDRQDLLADLREKAGRLLPQLAGVPLITVSALTGRGLDRLMAAVVNTYDIWNRRVPTAKLNKWLADMLERHPPPAVSGRRIKLRYLTQAKARPPTFVAFCSRPEVLPAAYSRYLVHGLRDDFDLPGVPIRLMMRKGENPYDKRKKKS